MPTLVRLLTILALIAGAIVAVMAALVSFVEPRRVPVTTEIPVPGLQQAAPAPASAVPAAPATNP